MGEDIKLLGEIINLDASRNIITIRLDFINPDHLKNLEDFFINKKIFTFSFKKPFRRTKTYPQLKRYYRILKQILLINEVFPDSKNIKILDEYYKQKFCEVEELIFLNTKIILPISKAKMTTEQLNDLTQKIIEDNPNLNLE